MNFGTNSKKKLLKEIQNIVSTMTDITHDAVYCDNTNVMFL